MLWALVSLSSLFLHYIENSLTAIGRDNKGNGVCGLGPKFCGDKCTSSCDYKSECDPGWGPKWSNATECPLKVCCSEFGFCGVLSQRDMKAKI